MRLFVSSLVAGGLTIASGGCEQGSEPPPETPNRASRPPDRTEVTMEISDAAPPGEKAALDAVAASGADAAATTAVAESELSDDPNIGGPQPDPAVEKAVAPLRPRLRACYKKALAADPNVGGSATFDATIGKDGKVASARFVKRDGLNEDMVGCLLVAVKSMTFDAGKKSQIVALSFGTPPGPAAAAADAGTKH